MATEHSTANRRLLDLRRWTAMQSGASLPKTSIRNMLRNREIGVHNRSQGHHASSAPITHGAFTASERANLANSFLPNEWNMIAATDSELFRCLHLPSEGLVTLSQEKLLRYYIRERSEYELTKQFCLPNREGVVTDLARSFRGDRLAYSSSKAYVYHCFINQIEDESNWNMFHTAPVAPTKKWEAYFSVRYTLDDEHLVVGGTGGYVNIIGSDHPTCYSFNAHQSDVRAICCSKANPHIFYSGSVDGQCKIWDDRSLNDSIPLAITSRSGYSVTYIDSDSYDRYMVVTTLGETIDIWDLRRIPENLPQRQTTELRFDTALRIKAKNILEVFWRAKFSPQRTGHRYIYCGSDGGHIYVFDILTNQIVREFRKCRREVRDCSWHPNDCEIISVSLCGGTSRWYYEG